MQVVNSEGDFEKHQQDSKEVRMEQKACGGTSTHDSHGSPGGQPRAHVRGYPLPGPREPTPQPLTEVYPWTQRVPCRSRCWRAGSGGGGRRTDAEDV